MKDIQWEHYKKTYRSIHVSNETLAAQWESVYHRLPQQENIRYRNITRFGFAFLGLAALVTIALVSASQTAQPGDRLYAVKVLSENVIKAVTGVQTIEPQEFKEVEKRAVDPTITPSEEKQPEKKPGEAEEAVKGAQTDNGRTVTNSVGQSVKPKPNQRAQQKAGQSNNENKPENPGQERKENNEQQEEKQSNGNQSSNKQDNSKKK